MKFLALLITIHSFTTTAFVVDVAEEKLRPLNALGLNEPFAQVNPTFSKIRKTRIISPPVAVVAEDDVVGQETMGIDAAAPSFSRARTARRTWKTRTEKPWNDGLGRDNGSRTTIIAEGGDVKKGIDIMEEAVARTSRNGAARTSTSRASIVAEGGDVRGANVMEEAVGAHRVSRERARAKGTVDPSQTTSAPSDSARKKEAKAWTVEKTKASASASEAEEEETLGCFVSTTRTFVASTDGEADGSTTRKFVAGPSCSTTDEDGAEDDNAEDNSVFDASFRGAVMYEAFAGVGDALAGCGEALMMDTMAGREILTNWMLLFPLFSVSGGSAALVGELIVAAIVALLVRNAAKIQEAVIHDEEAASKYEQDGWWGNFVSEMDETTKFKKSQSAKKVTYVKVLKDSLVKDILGKRPYEHKSQLDISRTISGQEMLSEEAVSRPEQEATIKDMLDDSPVEHPIVEQPRLERTTAMDNLVLEFPVLSSTDEFRTNHMLDFYSVPAEAWKDPLVLDILKKKKVLSSTTSPLYAAQHAG